MDLRKTEPTEAQSGQNRDEQNKQFVGDLLFGHNPPDQNDSGGKKQQKHKEIKNMKKLGYLRLCYSQDTGKVDFFLKNYVMFAYILKIHSTR